LAAPGDGVELGVDVTDEAGDETAALDTLLGVWLGLELAAAVLAEVTAAVPVLLAAAPVAVLVPLVAAVPVHTAAVGRFVTPTGLQMPFAYAITLAWSALLQALATQQVIPAMKLFALQIHLGARLQDAGMALTTQLSAQTGRPVKLCAEANPARSVAATMLWNFMFVVGGQIESGLGMMVRIC